MEAILFIGIQATGKSSFFKERFFRTHVHISLDVLNTRNKQALFLDSCFKTHTKFVVDNTNVTKEERASIICPAKERKYQVIGYYFNSEIKAAIARNQQRTGKAKIPERGILGCYNKLELPSYEEGFDQLYYVSIEKNQFVVSEWKK